MMTGIVRPPHGQVSMAQESLGATQRGTRMFQHRQWDALSKSSGATQHTQETVAADRWQAGWILSMALGHYST